MEKNRKSPLLLSLLFVTSVLVSCTPAVSSSLSDSEDTSGFITSETTSDNVTSLPSTSAPVDELTPSEYEESISFA